MAGAIDTHVHLWDLAGYRGYDGWFAGREYLRRDYLPHHLRPDAFCHAAPSVLCTIVPSSPTAT